MTSADREALRRQLMRHEGLRLKPYMDTVGTFTIGHGRNLESRGISEAEALYLLDNDIAACINDLVTLPWFADLDPVRQRVFVDLCFNLGIKRLLEFTKMLDAAVHKDWPRAARELMTSRYAEQVGQRARTLAAMLRTGTEVA